MTRKTPTRKDEHALRPVRANLGLELAYRRQLRALINEMAASVEQAIRSAYRARPPKMAQDAPPDASGFREPRAQSPALALRDAIRKLVARWQQRFNDAAPKLAEYFSRAMADRSDSALRAILRDGGFSVRFKMTREMNDVLRATIEQQVGLIRSIPEQYLGKVQNAVMRSVQTGRDLATLTDEIEALGMVTRKRAAFIARDQSNKSTSALTRVRQVELGITDAVWMHSHAGVAPRKTHVQMDGKTYPLAKGMWDPAVQEYIFPGFLPNCRCVSRPILPGLAGKRESA